MKKISDSKKRLITQFHTVLHKNGMMKQKPDILESFGVESTLDLREDELKAVIDSLNGEADKWRKRLIASVYGWLKAMNIPANTEMVKAIACRAASQKRFNDISTERLRSLYYAFNKKQKDLSFVDAATAEELKSIIGLN